MHFFPPEAESAELARGLGQAELATLSLPETPSHTRVPIWNVPMHHKLLWIHELQPLKFGANSILASLLTP
jgi:hypothetical protein